MTTPSTQILEEGQEFNLTYKGSNLGKFSVVAIFFETACVKRLGDSFQTYIPKEYRDGRAEEFQIYPLEKKDGN